MDNLQHDMEQGSTYAHNASFTGIFVIQPARITAKIIPNLQALYIPLGRRIGLGIDGNVFAYCPNAYHDWFYHYEWQEGGGSARFISPLRYILSAN